MSPIYVPGKVVLAQGQPVPNDPNFAFNSLLLHGNGTNGSTVITDSSGSPKTVTAVGNAQISTAIADPFGSTTGVLAFDGTGDYLTGTTSQADDFNLPGDFTIESWIYLNSTSGTQTIAGKWATGQQAWIFQTTNTSLLIATGNSGTFSTLSSASTTWAPSTWYHVGATRSGSNIRLFRNGVLIGTNPNTANATSANTTSVIYVGMNQDGSQQLLNGYIDDLRITKGVARYTANFTPPTLPFPDF
jgi:hypothetical protein